MQLSSVPVWKDLDFLRKYGNSGAHARWAYLSGGKLSPSSEVVVCVVRFSQLRSTARCSELCSELCSALSDRYQLWDGHRLVATRL